MRDIEWDLQQVENLLTRIRERIEADEDIGLLAELMETVGVLDERYKEFCDEIDREDGEEVGSMYNDEFGPNIEFYIEADDWHKISLAFRKLRNSQ